MKRMSVRMPAASKKYNHLCTTIFLPLDLKNAYSITTIVNYLHYYRGITHTYATEYLLPCNTFIIKFR